MATHEERILEVLAVHKTEEDKIMGAQLAKAAKVPVSDLGVYLANLKKKGYYIESDRGRPAHYWAPKGVQPIDGPASGDMKVGGGKKKKMPKSMTDPSVKALKALMKKASEEGKTLDEVIAEKKKDLEAEEMERAKKASLALQDKVVAMLKKSDLSKEAKIEVAEGVLKTVKAA